MRKILSIVLSLAMMLSLIIGTSVNASAETDFKGYYKITNAGNLCWFASLVVGGAESGGGDPVPNAKAYLVNDIDMSTLADRLKRTWSGIGTKEIPFTGVLDGNGHTIAGLKIDTSDDTTLKTATVAKIPTTTTEQGLVSVLGEGGIVRNLILKGSASVAEGQKLGAVCSENNGTIENVMSLMAVDGGDSPKLFCHSNNGTIKNCATYGTVSAATSASAEFGGTVTNCYYQTATTNENGGKTANEFASGEVTYLLNESKSEGDIVWYQNLDNGCPVDDLPVLFDTHGTVYYLESIYTNANEVKVIIDGSTASILTKGEEYTIPSSTLSKFVGYTDGTDYYVPGDKVKLNSYLTLTSKTFTISMIEGASFRVNDQTGIRFYTSIDEDSVTLLREAGYTVAFGTIIAPTDKLGTSELNHSFGTVGKDYIDVKYTSSTYFVNGEWEGIVGSIVKIKNTNMNRDFVGRGYVTVTKGDFTTTVYADYYNSDVVNNTRNVAYLANLFKNSDNFNALDAIKQDIVNEYASYYTAD